MPEYIEREAVVERINNSIRSWSGDYNSNAPRMVSAYKDVLFRIQSVPTADVTEVKHGEWEREFDEQGIDRGYKCSACRNSVYQMTYEPYMFCPHCGARMDGKEKRDA